MKRKPLNKKALRRAIWSSFSRVISIGLAYNSGMILHRYYPAFDNPWIAVLMGLVSLVLMSFAEYKHENEE